MLEHVADGAAAGVFGTFVMRNVLAAKEKCVPQLKRALPETTRPLISRGDNDN